MSSQTIASAAGVIDTPRIVQTTAQHTAFIHLTVPRIEMQSVMGPGIGEVMAGDERNFVKKAVNMALRAIGKRNRALNAAAVATARQLAASQDATAQWIGKDALRELVSPAVLGRLKK